MMKILLVDDEELILYSLSRMLRFDGAEVTAVTSGSDALRELHRERFDLFFLDVQLPDANGLDLMKIIREHAPVACIVIMTADCLDDEQQRSLRGQGCHYLPKPFAIGDVQALMAGFLSCDAAGSA